MKIIIETRDNGNKVRAVGFDNEGTVIVITEAPTQKKAVTLLRGNCAEFKGVRISR